MATEEQTDVSGLWSSFNATTLWGQRLTITNRIVSELSFYLKRVGTVAGGTLVFLIRAVDGDAVLLTKDWGSPNSISTTAAWYKVEFDTPININEEVYLLAGGVTGTAGSLLQVYDSEADVKADEYMVRRVSGVYTNYTGQDFGYKYTYISQEHGGGVYPVDDLTRASSIRHIYRPGFFRMQVGLGDLGFDVDIARALLAREVAIAKEELPAERGNIVCTWCGAVVPYREYAQHLQDVHPELFTTEPPGG